MFQRLLLAFSLIVSFGVAQIGALTHEISHYDDLTSQNLPQNLNQNADSSQNHLSPDKSVPHQQLCEKCFSYAQLSDAVQNTDLALPIAATRLPNLNHDSGTSSYAQLRAYSARAPPTFA